MQKYLIYQHQESSKIAKVTFCSLFTNQYRRQMLAGTLFQFFQQFSGINFFIFYSTKIFEDIGQNGKIVNFVLAFSNLASSFLAMWTVDRFGRKSNFIIGIFVQGIALLGFT